MTIFQGCVSETTNELHRQAFDRASAALRSLTEANVLAPIVVHEVIHPLLPGEVHGCGLFKETLEVRDWESAARGDLRLGAATATRLREVLAARISSQTSSR